MDAPKISAGAHFKVLAVDIPIAHEGFLTLASKAQAPYAGTDSRLVVVNALAEDAPMTHAGAVSIASTVDALMISA